MLLGMLVPVGGQLRGVRGDKRGHIRPLSPRGPLTKPLPPPLFLLKEGKSGGGGIASNSSVSLQEHCRGTTPGFRGLLGHMVSKRFARPSMVFTWISSRNCLQPQFPVLWSFHRTRSRLCATSGIRIPSGQGGDSSYRQHRSRLLQRHFCGPKEAEGILEADNRPIPVKPVLTGSSFQNGNHQVDSGGDATRRLGSITGPTGRVYIFTSLYIQITSVIFDFALKVEYTSSKLCLTDWPLLR
jgi:hypothetical protein